MQLIIFLYERNVSTTEKWIFFKLCFSFLSCIKVYFVKIINDSHEHHQRNTSSVRKENGRTGWNRYRCASCSKRTTSMFNNCWFTLFIIDDEELKLSEFWNVFPAASVAVVSLNGVMFVDDVVFLNLVLDVNRLLGLFTLKKDRKHEL